MTDLIEEHFDCIAKEYDSYKKKNWYYYSWLKKLYGDLIPDASKVNILEIGCGTGDILASLNPLQGVGVDVSAKMIEIAKEKHGNSPNLEFFKMAAEDLTLKQKFDYIILVDVIEHLRSVEDTVRALRKISGEGTRIIISMANPFWEPLLLVAEKLKLKMPEGEHYRIEYEELKRILKKNGFRIRFRGHRLLVPKKVVFSDAVNQSFYKIPFIRKMGLVEFMAIQRDVTGENG